MGPPAHFEARAAVPAAQGAVHKVVHYKDVLKCDHGGTVDLSPTLERRTEIKADLRVVTDQDLLQRVTLKGCSVPCSTIVSIQTGLARDLELKAGAIPVLDNLIATTDKGCTVKFAAAGGGYSPTDAVNHLNAAAHEHSLHRCGEYVENAIRAGGIPNLPGANATDLGPVLTANGFTAVATNDTAGFQPQAGDVTVIPATDTHEFGHTAMWNGDQWVSDFRQHNMAIWRDDPNPTYTIYRHTGTAGGGSSFGGNQAHAGPQ